MFKSDLPTGLDANFKLNRSGNCHCFCICAVVAFRGTCRSQKDLNPLHHTGGSDVEKNQVRCFSAIFENTKVGRVEF
jgi:hypothetical protein